LEKEKKKKKKKKKKSLRPAHGKTVIENSSISRLFQQRKFRNTFFYVNIFSELTHSESI